MCDQILTVEGTLINQIKGKPADPAYHSSSSTLAQPISSNHSQGSNHGSFSHPIQSSQGSFPHPIQPSQGPFPQSSQGSFSHPNQTSHGLFSHPPQASQGSYPVQSSQGLYPRPAHPSQGSFPLPIPSSQGSFPLSIQPSQGSFSRPTGVTIDLLNRLVISDKDNHRVQVYTMDGEFVTMFGRLGQRDTEFNYPWGVAVNSDNALFIADSRNTRIVCYSAQHRFLRKTNFKKRITPRAITCLPDDTLLVSDFEDHCVYLVNSDLTMRTVVSSNVLASPLNRPQCLATDLDGLIYVVESKPKRFQIFLPNEESLCCIESDSLHGSMNEPSGICVTRDGRVIIADSQNHRLLIFR